MPQTQSGILIEAPAGNLHDIEEALRAQLPGQLDVALVPLTEKTALLRPHLVRAFQLAHPQRDLGAFLGTVGAQARVLTEEQALARLQTRLPVELPRRRITAVAQEQGLDWHLQRCRVPEAWDLVGGPAGIAWMVRVGQLDTGYTRHPALGFGTPAPWLQETLSHTFVEPPDPNLNAVMITEPGGGLDPLTGISAGHGTRMASTISGFDPAAEGGAYFGVAPKVPLVMTRVTDLVFVPDRQREMTEALNHLVRDAKVDVINISLGFLPPGATLRELKRALNGAYDAGVIVVCAAGNYVESVVVPARLNRTVAVAGVTSADVPWSGSCFGPDVDMSAPAKDLRRADVARRRGSPSFSYAQGGDGTSYATAMTTGAAALWLQHRRADIAAAYTQPWQKVAAFRQLVRDSARVPGVTANGATLWQPGAFGTGVLDVAALLKAALPAAGGLQAEAGA